LSKTEQAEYRMMPERVRCSVPVKNPVGGVLEKTLSGDAIFKPVRF
jgi:hypothetical protein